MRPIIHTLMAIVTVMLLNAHAFATTAIWAEGNDWNIRGNSEDQYCHLSMHYETAGTILVYADAGVRGTSMAISGRNLRPLTEGFDIVEANLTFSGDQHYPLVARVLDRKLIVADVPMQAVLDFANTVWMEVRVRGILIGRYSLNGTRRLIEELGQCVLAMDGDPT